MSSIAVFAGQGAGLQLPWGILGAPHKSTLPNFAPAFPTSVTQHLAPQPPPAHAHGECFRAAPQPRHETSLPLSAFERLQQLERWARRAGGGFSFDEGKKKFAN